MNAHPAAAIFPILTGDALAELADDIRANGLRQPIVTFEGQVLDGRNRLAACRLAMNAHVASVAPLSRWAQSGTFGQVSP